ncbi:MAG TPA: TonB-dependent receptor, partial [Oleiagrimonas sp.]|nr:TonB-dependent receptor [Oleiagrimonas sp.]
MRHSKHRLAIDIGCALLASSALGLAAPAFAEQDASSADRPVQNETSAEDQPEQLATTVVTALSRKQKLEDVPIAIQVISAKSVDMHAATDLSKMDEFVPGLVIHASQPTQPRYQIRGIGSNNFGIGGAPSVGVYIDGVYSGRTGASLLAFNDVKRIEVLKGPQGTLFGRNTAAGAISVITNRPSHQFEAHGRIRVGRFGERYGNALVNLPVGDDMAYRFSVFDNQSDGWARDAVTGKHYGGNDDWGARMSWLWDPSDSTEFWLTFTHERLDMAGRPAFGVIPLSDDNYQRAPYPADPATYLDPLDAPLLNDADGYEKRRYNNIRLHIDHYMDWGHFTSITSWTQFNTTNLADFDGTNHIVDYLDEGNVESNRSLYHEFRLSGDTRLMNWVVGASWYKEDAHQRSQVDLYTDSIDSLILNLGIPTGTPDGTLYHYFNSVLQAYHLPFTVLGEPWREETLNHQRYTSMALYGDVIWHLTDSLDLTTGVRLSRDIKHFSWYNMPREAASLDQTINTLQQMGLLAAAGVNPAVFRQNLVLTDAVGVPVQVSDSWSDVSPRIVLSDHFTDNVMGYVSVAKGYQAGGYNSVQVNSYFEPEKVWNYEAGIKSSFPEQHLVVNASIYHYKYSNLQSLRLDPNTAGSGVPRYLVSSSDEKADGMDVAMQWHPTRAFTLNL